MSVDPSAIPNFGGQPPGGPDARQSGGPQEGRPQQGRRPTAPIIPNQELVKQLLERMKLKYVVDKQGDLVAPWKSFRTYIMFRGEKQQRIMSVRTFYDRPYTVEDKPRLLEAVDEWHHTTLWPKVYTHTNDEGTVRLIGEAQMLIGVGVSFDHFVSSLVSWVRAAVEFDKWLVNRLGLEKELDNGEAGPNEGEGGGREEDA